MSIENIIGHTFRSANLLKEALTHPSCAESYKGLPYNYQRLEFLGDGVLGLVVAELLFQMYPGEAEGSLAKRHAALVCSDTLAKVARTLGIGEYIRMATGENGNGGRESTS